MDTASLATTYATTTQAQTGRAIQSEIMKMAAEQDASVVALLQEGAQSLETAVASKATPPAGLGGQVDVSV